VKRAVLLGATVILVLLLAAPSYADVLLTAADWQMNETSGQMTDSSGNENNGDPTDARQTGSRYVFNGSTSYVAVPDSDWNYVGFVWTGSIYATAAASIVASS
jgi:hypothetical protein